MASCIKIKVRTDTSKLVNMTITGFGRGRQNRLSDYRNVVKHADCEAENMFVWLSLWLFYCHFLVSV